MAEGFRFMPLGLVRLRTFRLSTWVSWMQTWVQVLTRVREGCVVHSCQNKNPIERLTSGCEWRHAPEAHACGGFWRILKKSVSWVESCLERRRLAFACSLRPDEFARYGEVCADEKARIERMCISLLMSKNL